VERNAESAALACVKLVHDEVHPIRDFPSCEQGGVE
jgi:hypothetical protein